MYQEKSFWTTVMNSLAKKKKKKLNPTGKELLKMKHQKICKSEEEQMQRKVNIRY